MGNMYRDLRITATLIAILFAAVVGGGASATIAPDQFSEIAASAGLTYVGPSWGSAWGDFDGDGFPDIWLVDHYNPPRLYRNLGDGTFLDVSADLLPAEFLIGSYDTHGAAWADFDADGDLDLYQLADGGTLGLYPALLFVQGAEGRFTEMAAAYGLDYPAGRGRMPLWLDYDRDGQLDVLNPTTRLAGTGDGPTALFRQDGGSFTDVADVVGLVPNVTGNCDFIELADLTGDGFPELLPNLATFPERVYEMTGQLFQNVRYDIGLSSTFTVIDAVVADLDGDLANELYLVRGEATHGLVQSDATTIEAHIGDYDNKERGITFVTTGDITLGIWPRWKWSLDRIFIGTGGSHPEDYTFALAPADSATWGIPPHVEGDPGLFIGYEPDLGAWTVTRSKTLLNLVVTADAPFTAAVPVGWEPTETPPLDRYLHDDGVYYRDLASAAGIAVPSSGRSVVAADFDNDMDLDLFIVATGPVVNLPDILYENDGSGTFTLVPGAGGAAGGAAGRGDNATVADFDRDGYLDLLVTNGVSKPPFDYDGPTHLFRNNGGGNHWLEVDLEGTISNRDGIGAQLFLSAGGVEQIRSQDAGIHCRGQNHQRVHFGLGPHTVVDELRVTWPSGIVQVLTGVEADQVLLVQEPVASPVAGDDLPAGGPRLLGCFPNPFNPSTTIAFSVPERKRVKIAVFDVSGRQIRILVDGIDHEPGRHEVVWHGRDDEGRPVASGTYFYRMDADGFIATGSMALLK